MTSLTLDSHSTLEMQITGTTAGTFDQIKVSDFVSLSGTLSLSGLDAITALGTTLTLIDVAGSDPAAISGEFSDILVSGSSMVITLSGSTYTFTYRGVTYQLATTGGNGNDVTLKVASAVPEPATWALLLGGAGLFAWRSRRRQP